jgi:hypothetical protein
MATFTPLKLAPVGTGLTNTSGEYSVTPNTTQQKVNVSNNGTSVGTRQSINLIPGTGISISASDNTGADRVDVTVSTSSSAPLNYNQSADFKWASASTITIASIACTDSSGTTLLTKSSSTTVDFSTTGLNGIAQSANLAGTISVTATGTVVTGSGTSFTTDYIVGDVIRTAGGQTRRITAISSNTSITVESAWTTTESGVTYRRGGFARNTTYRAYAISNGTTVGVLMSTRSVALSDSLVDLPSGYTLSRQLLFTCVTLTSTNTIRNFQQVKNLITYYEHINITNGNSTSFATVSLSPFIPREAQKAYLFLEINPVSGQFNSAFLRTSSSFSSLLVGVPINATGVQELVSANFETTGTQTVDYVVNNSSMYLAINVKGYFITEIVG